MDFFLVFNVIKQYQSIRHQAQSVRHLYSVANYLGSVSLNGYSTVNLPGLISYNTSYHLSVRHFTLTKVIQFFEFALIRVR